jgi:hypothetical protein
MIFIITALAEQIGEVAAEIGLAAAQDGAGRVLPAEAIVELRECLAAAQRARTALERALASRPLAPQPP